MMNKIKMDYAIIQYTFFSIYFVVSGDISSSAVYSYYQNEKLTQLLKIKKPQTIIN